MRRKSVYRAVGIFAAVAWTFAAGTAQQAPAPPMPVPAILQAYKPVTPERLLKPDEGDWLMIRRTYDGWGYSPLDADHRPEREAAEAGLVVLDRRDQRPSRRRRS